ncbi:MAG TPA: ATP-binding protein [Oligoflexia bacterium]|nr:ATP-binding protein [Oligoflexia bacterium]
MQQIYKLSQQSDRIEQVAPDTTALFSSVLLVEDDGAHAALIRRGWSGVVGGVDGVGAGREAVQALEEQLAEIVFCDLNLPDMSGVSVIRSIKTLRPGLPVIVLTSSSSLSDAVQAMREGAWDYMVKQFNDELRNQFRLIVNRTAERKLQQLRELKMRQERDAFWTAAYAAQDGLSILTEEGQVVFANEAFNNFCALLGSSAVGANIVDLISAQNFIIGRDIYRELKVQSADALWSSELEVVRAGSGQEKSSRFFELKLSNIAVGRMDIVYGGLPALRYRVLWLRDITQRKEQERFQRDLLSTTTHDLKGPLAAILTSAELIRESSSRLEERESSLLTKVASCARNAISIIDELLSARRIQDGVMIIRPRVLDLSELFDEITGDYQPVAKSREINLCYLKQECSGMQVYADRLGLTRVLGNLVSNALKFTPKHGRVELSAERIGAEVRIMVSDTGTGIDPRARHKLFQRFERLEKHNEIEGTGLGLFVVKNIVEAHNGRIEIKSQVGVGTAFIISLPDRT